MECADIAAARVNLAQYIALRFLADDSFTGTVTTTSAGAAVQGGGAGPGAVQSYFQGTVMAGAEAIDLPIDVYPYAYSKGKAVKDLFEVYHRLKKVCTLCRAAAKAASQGAEGVRLQLLEMNAEHTVAQWRRLCQRLYDQLAAVDA